MAIHEFHAPFPIAALLLSRQDFSTTRRWQRCGRSGALSRPLLSSYPSSAPLSRCASLRRQSLHQSSLPAFNHLSATLNSDLPSALLLQFPYPLPLYGTCISFAYSDIYFLFARQHRNIHGNRLGADTRRPASFNRSRVTNAETRSVSSVPALQRAKNNTRECPQEIQF